MPYVVFPNAAQGVLLYASTSNDDAGRWPPLAMEDVGWCAEKGLITGAEADDRNERVNIVGYEKQHQYSLLMGRTLSGNTAGPSIDIRQNPLTTRTQMKMPTKMTAASSC